MTWHIHTETLLTNVGINCYKMVLKIDVKKISIREMEFTNNQIEELSLKGTLTYLVIVLLLHDSFVYFVVYIYL